MTLNVMILQMSHMILPQMLARGGGYIVNLSSVLSIFSPPYLGLYSATKVSMYECVQAHIEHLMSLSFNTYIIQSMRIHCLSEIWELELLHYISLYVCTCMSQYFSAWGFFKKVGFTEAALKAVSKVSSHQVVWLGSLLGWVKGHCGGSL